MADFGLSKLVPPDSPVQFNSYSAAWLKYVAWRCVKGYVPPVKHLLVLLLKIGLTSSRNSFMRAMTTDTLEHRAISGQLLLMFSPLFLVTWTAVKCLWWYLISTLNLRRTKLLSRHLEGCSWMSNYPTRIILKKRSSHALLGILTKDRRHGNSSKTA